MSLPGKKLLRHWFWIVMFRYPRLRIQLTQMLLAEREVDIQIFGAPLRINTREEIGLWRAAKIADENIVFRDEAASLLNLALLLRPRDVFVDVGANVGLYSSVLSRFQSLFPETKFVAIEANPATARRLRQSVAGREVTVMNIGASNRATELAFERGVTSGVFRVAAPGRTSGVTRIPCERLDALNLPAGDLVVKIDVEEHELPVLEGASGLFEQERIKVIYLDGYGSAAIPPLLRRHGFVLFDGRTLAPSVADLPDFSLLAVHQSRLPQLHGH
ncbi:MAG: FkbM family methyltransferase [Chthoniobacterales bacterium]